ncbi:MAG: hypothetical protein ACREQ7_07425 [Candidatus Binatia bacterium]
MSDATDKRQLTAALARIWWLRLPLVARRLSAQLALTLLDGFYLVAWPRMAALLPPVAFVTGLLIGWQYGGITVEIVRKPTVFTQSLAIMGTAAALGVMSAQLGALFLAGFAFGDFFLAHPSLFPSPGRTFEEIVMLSDRTFGGRISYLIRARIPLLIEYGVLGLLAVSIPLMTKALVSQLSLPSRVGRNVRFAVAVLGHGALTAVLVYFWAQIAVILIRPVFTWMGDQPTVAAVQPLQSHGHFLVLIAVTASLARMCLQGLTAFRLDLGKRLDNFQQDLASASPVLPAADQVNPWVIAALRTLWATLLLSGLLTNWPDALMLGTVILFVQTARSGLIQLPIAPWRSFVQRIPVLLRLVAGSTVVYYLAQMILQWQIWHRDSFRPIVLVTGIAFLIFFALMPGVPAAQKNAAARSS